MNFVEKIKNNKKLKISLIVLSIIFIFSIIFIVLTNNNTKEVDNRNSKIEKTLSLSSKEIVNVNEKNTKFNISTLEEAENVVISVTEKLEEYELFYLMDITDEIISENIDEVVDDDENTKEVSNSQKVDIKDYSKYIKYENEITLEQNANIYFIYGKDGVYSTEPYKIEITNIVKVLQESEEVSEEQLEAEKVDNTDKKNNIAPYYIRVNYGANTVTIYAKDENDEYTVPIKAMVCSCGRATPKGGVYKTSRGYAWGTLVGGVYGQYSTRIVGSILFHSVPYTERSKDSLEYWEYDKLGTTASAGCVRLTVEDSYWIYCNCGSGVMVEFYSDSDPGPLGKPSARKISDNEACRDWDPTDYAEGNPWLSNGVEEEAEENNEEVEVQVENSNVVQNENQNKQNNNTENKVQNTNSNVANKVTNTTTNNKSNTTTNNATNTVINNTTNSTANNSTNNTTNTTANNDVNNNTINNTTNNNSTENQSENNEENPNEGSDEIENDNENSEDSQENNPEDELSDDENENSNNE